MDSKGDDRLKMLTEKDWTKRKKTSNETVCGTGVGVRRGLECRRGLFTGEEQLKRGKGT